MNEELAQRIVIDSDATRWTASPQPCVDRNVPEYLDPENERVSTVVRLATYSMSWSVPMVVAKNPPF